MARCRERRNSRRLIELKTILVDDEIWGLKRFEIECNNVADVELVGKFRSSEEALSFAEENRVDLAFLDIEMPKMSGLELYDRLKELYPDIVVIFVSAYPGYLPDAMIKREADYFIPKPYTESQVISAIERAKLLSARQKKQITIRTFGNFEVSVNGEALKFTSLRAKEILALLVDRNGDSMSMEALYNEMYPEQDYSNQEAAKLRHAMQRLQKTLEEAQIENILHYYPHSRALKCDMVKCDYHDFLNGDSQAIKDYKGKYMFQFSWGEARITALNTIKERIDPSAADELYEE